MVRVFLLILLFSLSSCAVQKAVTVAEPAGFIERQQPGDGLQRGAVLPFDYASINNDSYFQKYSKLLIAPVIVNYIPEDEWRKSSVLSIGNKETFVIEVNNLAVYFEQALTDAMQDYGKNRFEIVPKPGPGTLMFEIALTEVVFKSPVVYAASYAAPIPGASHLLSSTYSPSLAFELKVLDAETFEVLASFADRRLPRIKLIDLRRLTSSGPLEEIIEIWSELFAKTLNMKREETVSAPTMVTLIPW